MSPRNLDADAGHRPADGIDQAPGRGAGVSNPHPRDPTGRPEPPVDSVEIDLLDLPRLRDDLVPYSGLLSVEETARAGRLRTTRAHQAFVLTRGHLKIRLAQYLGIPPESVCFETNPHGKPRLRGLGENLGLVFNISHSGDFALLGLAWNTALGVDIEAPRPLSRLEALAHTCLTHAELARWQGFPDDQRRGEFLKLWTCKEAFFKATGRGIALGLKAVSIAADFRSFDMLPSDYGPRESWQLHAWQEGNCRTALAYSGKRRRLSIVRHPS